MWLENRAEFTLDCLTIVLLVVSLVGITFSIFKSIFTTLLLLMALFLRIKSKININAKIPVGTKAYTRVRLSPLSLIFGVFVFSSLALVTLLVTGVVEVVAVVLLMTTTFELIVLIVGIVLIGAIVPIVNTGATVGAIVKEGSRIGFICAIPFPNRRDKTLKNLSIIKVRDKIIFTEKRARWRFSINLNIYLYGPFISGSVETTR